jgi:alpha-L-rhamnosidase
VRGPVAVAWERARETLTLRVSIPPGSSATVLVPTDEVGSVLEGGRPAREADGVEAVSGPPGTAAFEIASGNYEFRSRLGANAR